MNATSLATIACVSAAAFYAQAAPPKKADRVAVEGLITADPLPEGYAATKTELKEDDKLGAYLLVFSKEGAVSKVAVTIETRTLTNRAEKIAALKGYVNGTTQTLTNAGMKLVKKKIPNLDKVNVDKRTTCEFVYETAEGAPIDVQIQVFFTDNGHDVLVIADNKDDYKALTKWAKSIRGVEAPEAGERTEK